MQNASPLSAEGTIPGWRVIRSDTGRFWASRVQPFTGRSEEYAPPYRTVDGDTFEQLRAEAELQEKAARELEAIPGEAAEPPGAGQAADDKATSGAASGQVKT